MPLQLCFKAFAVSSAKGRVAGHASLPGVLSVNSRFDWLRGRKRAAEPSKYFRD
jgi:hypothetical protein